MIRRLLLVEGNDDEHVMYALLKAQGVPQSFAIQAPGGVHKLLENLDVRLKARNEDCLGVLLDADEDIEQRWHEIRTCLARRGFSGSLPERPEQDGTVVDLDDTLRFGVWLMPDNTLPGILESFLRFLVPDGDPLFARITNFIESLPAELRRFPAVRQPKALIHSWLALQEEPGRPLGQAITCRYLDASAEIARPLLGWIERLFVHE